MDLGLMSDPYSRDTILKTGRIAGTPYGQSAAESKVHFRKVQRLVER
jgi:hypothetical protein